MNIDEILNYKKPDQTYYEILGCDPSSSYEQICKEYKVRALQLHPDKSTDPQSEEKFRLLQRAKDVLTDEVTRRSYDSWLNSRIHIPFEQWQNKKGHSMHWASPRPSKLSILQDSSIGQGSDSKVPSTPDQKSVLLDKFRKYEI